MCEPFHRISYPCSLALKWTQRHKITRIGSQAMNATFPKPQTIAQRIKWSVHNTSGWIKMWLTLLRKYWYQLPKFTIINEWCWFHNYLDSCFNLEDVLGPTHLRKIHRTGCINELPPKLQLRVAIHSCMHCWKKLNLKMTHSTRSITDGHK